MEGIEHASHIPYQRPFDAAIADGPPGVPFKIDKHKILAGGENLAQMEIAVTAVALDL
jgi:hypothetical protein